MLNKGMRSEEDQRINSILQKLMTLVFLPENWNELELQVELNKMGMSVEDLRNFDSNTLNQHLVKFNFDWNHMEQFADALVVWSKREGHSDLKEKAKELYQFIQTESKSFSFEIMNKISQL
ncbi:hypothetical protein [Flavobacterium sp. NKUCC04_CG]|uniref:hypothetical protein n=1 Tax=Flavobacterium sp. NKUCC04_CG TaxID=2842121 RepID=UPI001C5B0730|nr:hypothetical protein [Flavobacterium sp. NKUCC04_CG]MBW3518525.1 hypothetical protein [Flavobacterium sp. NKUCC04_CG]